MTIDSPTLAWALLAMVAAIVEIVTPHFGVIFVSAGAIAGAVVALLGGDPSWQILTFAVVVAVTFVVLRPRMVGWLGTTPGVPSRTEPLVGKRGVVTESIDAKLGTGRVIVAGEDWAARSTSAVAAGVEVRVVGADGIVLEVLP